jgi:hypothetical protein
MAHNPIADSGTTLASASGASSQSSAMAVKTDSLRITNNGTKNVTVAIGTDPTATANDYSVSKQETEILSLTPKSQPVIGITTGTSTILHFPEGTGCAFNVGDTVSVTGLTPSSLNFSHKPVQSVLVNASSQPGYFSTRAVITHDSSASTVGGASTATFNGGMVRNSVKASIFSDGTGSTVNFIQIQAAGGGS